MGNRYILLRYLIFIYLFYAVVSCKNSPEKSIAGHKPGDKEMADLNEYFVRKDRERIQNYIERKNLRMSESPTGLWYQLVKEGSGEIFSDNDQVIFDYECTLLDGTKCYSSKEMGPKDIILGRSAIETGLSEGLRMMKPGAEAIFIIPPFLAYGFIGDRKLIPPRAVIVYNIKILQSK
jgi:FKBP-type peptidyl-prolyl cis-trans isomerase FkpA